MKINRGVVEHKELKFDNVGDILVLKEKGGERLEYLVLSRENIAKTSNATRGARVNALFGHDSAMFGVENIYYLINLGTMYALPVRSRDSRTIISKARSVFEDRYDFVEVIPRENCEVNIKG